MAGCSEVDSASLLQFYHVLFLRLRISEFVLSAIGKEHTRTAQRDFLKKLKTMSQADNLAAVANTV